MVSTNKFDQYFEKYSFKFFLRRVEKSKKTQAELAY